MEPGGTTAEGMLTDRPFARPFWGLVGDFDTSAVTDYYPEAGANGVVGSLSVRLIGPLSQGIELGCRGD